MIKLFKNFRKKDWGIILICVVLIVIQVWLDLKLPDYMSEITKLIQTEGTETKDIIIQGIYMIFCAFGSLASAVIVGYLAATVSSSFSMVLREKIFKKVNKFSAAEVKKFQTSSLITRTTNDVTQMEMLVALGLQAIIKAPILAVWAVGKILNKSLELSVLTGACVAFLLISIFIIVLIVMPRFNKIQKLIDNINGVVRENLTGIRVIRAFNAEGYQSNRFNKVNNDLTYNQLFTQKTLAFLMPVMTLVMSFLPLGIYFIGAYLVQNALMIDKLTIFSNVVVFSSYGMQVILAFLMLAIIFMILPRASISAKRINEVLEEKYTIINGSFNGKTKEKGTIEFKNVSFKYPDADEYLLKNISFKANKGETIAFVGSTGSGKSSLINLVPRFYDATEGVILIDGVDIKEYKLKSLRNKLGYVSQKAFMFTNNVYQNVGYGDNGLKKPTKKQIEEAIKVAQATSFVEKMDKKYNSLIARAGTNVSGGQKQRLSIARAIVRNPEIYIFDDSFSALDFKTDAVLRKSLKKHTKDATLLIVAQRIGTIISADKIVVLDKGKCVGIGNHKELIKNCDVYKEIALSQLSKEELANV